MSENHGDAPESGGQGSGRRAEKKAAKQEAKAEKKAARQDAKAAKKDAAEDLDEADRPARDSAGEMAEEDPIEALLASRETSNGGGSDEGAADDSGSEAVTASADTD